MDIVINEVTNERIFDTGEVLFSCTVTLDDFDTTISPDVNVSWIGPNGLIENSTNSIIEQEEYEIDDSLYFNTFTLLLSNLDIATDNNTVYNCTVTVTAASEEYIEPNSASALSLPLVIEG